uniref:Uncharacterized protein n=1 Tax=Rhizophora mucronata TaxID=61149 RepID=A0A2P2NHL0_RHIMU
MCNVLRQIGNELLLLLFYLFLRLL